MTTFQLNGAYISPTIPATITSASLLALPTGCTGLIIVNPSATATLYCHLVPSGQAAPLLADVQRGIRIYPNTQLALSIINEPPYGCDVYLVSSSGSVQINAYGVY